MNKRCSAHAVVLVIERIEVIDERASIEAAAAIAIKLTIALPSLIEIIAVIDLAPGATLTAVEMIRLVDQCCGRGNDALITEVVLIAL